AALEIRAADGKRRTSFGVHEKEFAAWPILPAETQVRQERRVARAVLHQPGEEHLRRHGVDDAPACDARRELPFRQIDPVPGDVRLDAELTGEIHPSIERQSALVAVVEAADLDGARARHLVLLASHIARHRVLEWM